MQSRTKAGQWLIAALGGLSLAAAALPACAGTSSIMQVSGRTSQPIGHYEYCQKNRADCSIVSFNDRPMELTRALWSDMERINTYANAVIRPATDYQIFGVEEVWTLPTNYGDCEDYVLLKQKMLIAKIYQMEMEKRDAELAAKRGQKSKIGFGGQTVRNYVLHPDQYVKDARTGTKVGNPQPVLDGDIDRFLEDYLRWTLAESGAAR